MTNILSETQTGENFEYDDRENIKKYLVQKYQSWKNQEEIICGNEEAIQRYSRKNITKRLAEIFDKLLENNKEEKTQI